jgi:hypothetical protein
MIQLALQRRWRRRWNGRMSSAIQLNHLTGRWPEESDDRPLPPLVFSIMS